MLHYGGLNIQHSSFGFQPLSTFRFCPRWNLQTVLGCSSDVLSSTNSFFSQFGYLVKVLKPFLSALHSIPSCWKETSQTIRGTKCFSLYLHYFSTHRHLLSYRTICLLAMLLVAICEVFSDSNRQQDVEHSSGGITEIIAARINVTHNVTSHQAVILFIYLLTMILKLSHLMRKMLVSPSTSSCTCSVYTFCFIKIFLMCSQ